MLLPRNTSSSLSPYTIGPIFSLIPYLVTIALAIFVTLSKSFDAPVDISSIINSSATLPPSAIIIVSNISFLVPYIWSSCGNGSVNPPALPLGMIVTW